MGLLEWGREKLGWGTAGVGVPLSDVRFTALDTELTGLDERRDDIVSIGALHMQGARIELGNTFQALVRPKAVLDGRTVLIHGITPSQLEAMPPIGEVLAAFLQYVDGTVLLGHCVALDLGFLGRDLQRATGARLKVSAVDTLALYGWLRHRSAEHPAFAMDQAGLNLFSLAAAFGIQVEEAHTAIGDAFLTAQLLQRFLPFLQQAGVRDLASLLRVGHPKRAASGLATQEGHTHF